MIMDSMHQATDKRIKMLENRLAKEYKQAEREMKRKTKEFMASFKKKDKAKKKLVDSGELTKFEWIEWRKSQLFMSDLMQKQADIMTQQLVQTNLQATNIVNGQLAEVYAKHYNFAFYQLEKGLGINTSFTLYDANTVERLASKNPRLLPKKKLNTAKDAAWSKRKINNAIMQGVLQGEPLDDIAERLSKVAEMSWSAAVRTARTAMTGAQNAGRLDSLKQAEDMGIKVHKQWMATLDEHTRESHAELDGESVPVDEPFSNGLMYPADPDGDPAEVYNCRCTMVGDLVDYNEEYERYDNIEGEPIENMTYEEWEAAKLKNEPIPNVDIHTSNMEEYNRLKEWAKVGDIQHKPVDTLEERLTSEQIIEKLAGGDMTTGSCASLAFAYCANYHGLDVTDFRGGKSQNMFSAGKNIENMFKISNANVIMREVVREAKEAAEMLADIEKDKLYYFSAGRHVAIVRNDSEQGLQYLELQSHVKNGFKPFKTERYSVQDMLQKRFGCTKTARYTRGYDGSRVAIKSKVHLVDVDSMKMTTEFKDVLGYLNTATDKQKKGASGVRK